MGWQALLEVADTGIGISARHVPQVFERFYRVDPARGQEVESTGLGLAICRSIAEAHGGRLSIESVTGEGTWVSLALPLGGDNVRGQDTTAPANGRAGSPS